MSKDIFEVPKGFSFSTAAAGFKYKDRDDLALICSEYPCSGAGVFTKNKFQAAPILISKRHLSEGKSFRAILANAGQANACTGEKGVEDCLEVISNLAQTTELDSREIFPASTGEIGPRMDLQKWKIGLEKLKKNLGKKGPLEAAKAILTTDTFPKLAWKKIELGTGAGRILGMAKGSGMICPNMATMLGFVVTDLDLEPGFWQLALARAVDRTFNRISVDGDTSTNDCVLGLANAASGLKALNKKEQVQVEDALKAVCSELAYLIVQDAEGGTKVIQVKVMGARNEAEAEQAARSIAGSLLVKTAVFGHDPNWGRIVAALGRSGAEFAVNKVDIYLAGFPVFSSGMPVEADLDALLAPKFRSEEIEIKVDLKNGPGQYVFLGSDLGYDYVRINAEYRS